MCVGAVAEMFSLVGAWGGDWDHPQAIGCSGSSEDRLGLQFYVDIVVVEEVHFLGGENCSTVRIACLANGQ